MASGTKTPAAPARSRLIAFYGVLAVLVVAVSAAVLGAGHDRTPQEPVAGGYDVTAGETTCLGQSFDVKQSGRFVNLDNADGSLGGRLEFEDGRLTGEVDCVEGGSAQLDAVVEDGILTGTLAGDEVTAELKRDPPEPGAQKPLAPSSIAGDYKLSPRSACLGPELTVEGGSEVELLADGETVGEGTYADGRLEGELECPTGGMKSVVGDAVDRTINLTLLPPGAEPSATGAPPPGSERLSAEKQREAGSRFAAFFIAVAAVMLIARLFGMGAVALRQPRVMGEVVAGIALGPTILGAFLPDIQAALFPKDIIPILGVVAQLGLIFYMFLVGLEIDLSQLRGRPKSFVPN